MIFKVYKMIILKFASPNISLNLLNDGANFTTSLELNIEVIMNNVEFYVWDYSDVFWILLSREKT